MIFARRENLFEGQPVIGGIVGGGSGGSGGSGKDGKSLEYHWEGTRLGIRREGDTEYTYVDLKGATGANGINGKEVELSVSGDYLSWRYVGESAWKQLFDLTTIVGTGGGDVDMDILQPLLDEKVDKVQGFGLSENSFSDDEKEKLEKLDPSKQHEHNDLGILESFSLDMNGKLQYDGRDLEVDVAGLKNAIDTKPSVDDNVVTSTGTWSSQKLREELDTRSPLGHTHTDAEITNFYDNLYNKAEVDSLINALSMGFTWKEPVSSVAELTNLSPIPSETRIIANSEIFFFDGSQWVNIGGSSLPPMASDTIDGMMSSADKVKLDAINANAPQIVYSDVPPANVVNGTIWVVS